MNSFKTVGLVGKIDDASVIPTLIALAAHLHKRNVQVLIDNDSVRHHGAEGYAAVSRAEIAARSELVIVVGGDGTLLNAGRTVAPRGIPIVGVNLGRLGFMADVPQNHMTEILDQFLDGHYVIDERLVLAAHLYRGDEQLGPFYGINDVVVRNREFLRMLEFDSYLNETFISHHRADGIIVATPTGSTAYALSSAGPVLQPSLHAMTLVPICPHNLSDRPIVVDGDSCVQITIAKDNSTPAMVAFDGQSTHTLKGGDRVVIARANFKLRLVHPENYYYFNILRDKMHWGRGQWSESSDAENDKSDSC